VVNVDSLSGKRLEGDNAGYAMSKFAPRFEDML
jgi:hypothetical protein